MSTIGQMKFQASLVLSIAICIVAEGFPPSPFVTPYGFEYIGNTEGKIFIKAILSEPDHEYGVSWQRAIEICANAGYRLANIESPGQNSVIAAFVTAAPTDIRRWMWIDGTNFASSNRTWFSLNTGKTMEYTNFVRGRPVDGSGGYNPQCLRWSSNGMNEAGWWDVQCADTHNVLCETPVL